MSESPHTLKDLNLNDESGEGWVLKVTYEEVQILNYNFKLC